MSVPHVPYAFRGTVVSGFGRGGKQLGCPTANVDETAVAALPDDLPCGVFYGMARVAGGEAFDMVMSIGWNPHFEGQKKTIEVHLLHSFPSDFYGQRIDGVAAGYIREMSKFNGLDELIAAIQNDIRVAREELGKCDREKLIDMMRAK